MKKFFLNKGVLIGITGTLLIATFLFCLFFDAFYGTNFRSLQDKVIASQELDLSGLNEIRASGGTLVRFSDLKRKLKHIDGPIIIVDGMSEYHGYIKGIPTSFLSYHKRPKFRHHLRRLLLTGSMEKRPELVISEEEEAKKHNFEYKKVNIGSTFVSSDEDIDKIVAFYDSVSENAWLHFHCSHGKGRTSIMLVMLDTMKNAPHVPQRTPYVLREFV